VVQYIGAIISEEHIAPAFKLCIAGLISQSLQFHAQVMLASLGWCHKSWQCAKSCARRTACFCNRRDAVVNRYSICSNGSCNHV